MKEIFFDKLPFFCTEERKKTLLLTMSPIVPMMEPIKISLNDYVLSGGGANGESYDHRTDRR